MNFFIYEIFWRSLFNLIIIIKYLEISIIIIQNNKNTTKQEKYKTQNKNNITISSTNVNINYKTQIRWIELLELPEHHYLKSFLIIPCF